MRAALARIWEIEARVSIGRAGSGEVETAHARFKDALDIYGSINNPYLATLGSEPDA